MARRDSRVRRTHLAINNLRLSRQTLAAARELQPPRAKDGPGARIAYERAIAAANQAEAEALSIEPADGA